jgi:uncharacterized lipoprotein YmbA
MSRCLLLICVAAALTAGCARSPALHWHALMPSAAEALPPHDGAALPLQVVIVSTAVPVSIDRPQLVVRNAGGRVLLAEHERWEEPLKRAIPRTLAHYLARDLGGAIVWSSGASAPARPDARIMLEVARWQATLAEQASAEILWTVRAGARERSGRTRIDVPVNEPGYAALVAAHREGLRVLSRDIAAAVQSIAVPRP